MRNAGDSDPIPIGRTISPHSSFQISNSPKAQIKKSIQSLFCEVAVDRSETALRELYELMAPKILNVLRHVLKSPDDARDVLQDVFILIWDKAPSSYAEIGNASAWIIQLARNRAIDAVRSRRGREDRKTSSFDVNGEQGALKNFVEDNNTPEIELAAKEDDSELRRALSVLNPLQRRAVDLIYFGGMTHEQAAQELEIPSGSIGPMLMRAMAKLGNVLRPRMGMKNPPPPPPKIPRFVRGAW
jgi:RNA polymerase sigma-70 factor (ECF subfamily)